MKIFDISRPLFNGLAPWPGDTVFQYELKWKMAEGATVNVGAITMGAHNGSHADAPFHFKQGAMTIEHMPLETYLGDAVVVDLTEKFETDPTRPITIGDLESAPDVPRLLLKTGVWRNSKIFPAWIPVIAPGVAEWLGKRNVKLLGLDLPSVDPIEAKVLVNHHALAAAGIAIVESLDLSEVAAGTYHFSALPLRIDGGDAAPVRAILWRD
ncbi:MAG: cyclase family protein [Verrucomicrobiota bacterium]|nr:cyclase family protein [Verrucomicrobiota bacterium]